MSACKLYTWPLPSRSCRTAGPPTPGLGTSCVTSAVAGASGEGWAFGGRPSARRHRKDVLVLVPSQPPRQDSASGPPHREGASRPAPRSSAVLGRVPRLGPVPDRGRALPSGPRTWATTSSAHARAPFPAGLQSGPVLSPQPPAHRRGPGDCRGRCHLGLRGLPRRCPLRRGPGRELQPSRGPGAPRPAARCTCLCQPCARSLGVCQGHGGRHPGRSPGGQRAPTYEPGPPTTSWASRGQTL